MRPGGSPCERSAYSARIASGEESITSGVLKPVKLTLNASPYARRQASMNAIGRMSQRAVWIGAAAFGPAGSIMARNTRPSAVSSANAAASAMSSRQGWAATCTPIGSPSADVPQRTVAAGHPVNECDVV